jgi:hypothetical protein
MIEIMNTFRNFQISYKTFFDLNEEYYDEEYKDKTFKLFDKDDGGNESPMLKIVQQMTPPTGYNGEMVRKIKNADTNEDLSDISMKIRRVEVYNNNTDTVILVGKSSNRINRNPEDFMIGGSKASVKKVVCGKLRCIYKIHGSRKEHLKYKGRLITVAEYKKIMKH